MSGPLIWVALKGPFDFMKYLAGFYHIAIAGYKSVVKTKPVLCKKISLS